MLFPRGNYHLLSRNHTFFSHNWLPGPKKVYKKPQQVIFTRFEIIFKHFPRLLPLDTRFIIHVNILFVGWHVYNPCSDWSKPMSGSGDPNTEINNNCIMNILLSFNFWSQNLVVHPRYNVSRLIDLINYQNFRFDRFLENLKEFSICSIMSNFIIWHKKKNRKLQFQFHK